MGFKGQVQVYAVVRCDLRSRRFNDPKLEFTVKEILSTVTAAKCEVRRLNELNADKQCLNWWQATRFYPHGAAAGPMPLEDSN